MEIRIKVTREDSIPAFAAWVDGSLDSGEGEILLNIDACLGELEDEDGKSAGKTNRAQLIIGSLMHEFGHALEDILEVEHDEAMVESEVSKFFK